MNEICKQDICTGCSACVDKCPKQCISMIADSLGALHPLINNSLCVDCGACQKVCPSLISDDKHPVSDKVYAAWSNDIKTRQTSASGGIAAELYGYAISNGIISFGVTYEMGNGAHFIQVCNEEDILRVKNSKYVYSNPIGVFKRVKQYLIEGNQVLFIGLPCQVSALKRFVGNAGDKLFTVDIICHGVAPETYLYQHINYIEKATRKKTDEISFRDPEFKTYTFTFSLRNQRKVFYKKKANSRDVYQLGYHRALIYRENCYHCRFACPERVGDITISDFSGLGKKEVFEYDRHNVSCIICNSPQGHELIGGLKNQCTLVERPAEEAFKYEKQLQKPSVPHSGRGLFVSEYLKEGNFEKAAKKALRKDIFEVTIHKGEWKSIFKDVLRAMIPNKLLTARRQRATIK